MEILRKPPPAPSLVRPPLRKVTFSDDVVIIPSPPPLEEVHHSQFSARLSLPEEARLGTHIHRSEQPSAPEKKRIKMIPRKRKPCIPSLCSIVENNSLPNLRCHVPQPPKAPEKRLSIRVEHSMTQPKPDTQESQIRHHPKYHQTASRSWKNQDGHIRMVFK